MERVVLTIRGEPFAPSPEIWLWHHPPSGRVRFKRLADVQPGDVVSFEVTSPTGDRRHVQGEVEAVGPLKTSASNAVADGR